MLRLETQEGLETTRGKWTLFDRSVFAGVRISHLLFMNQELYRYAIPPSVHAVGDCQLCDEAG
jgi:hypothetical protein